MARTARPQNPNVCDGSAWHPPWSSFRDREETMTKFLAGVLTVIAAGVMLIAYGLLSPRVGAFASPGDVNGFAQPMFASEQGMIRNDPYAARYAYYSNPNASPYGFNYPSAPQAVPVSEVRPVRTVTTVAPPSRASETHVARRRDWKKTALIVGGSTAGGAGLGGGFGGKKGGLIGAAIGRGGGSVNQGTRKKSRGRPRPAT